jgi:hypothetical protein
MRKLRDIPFSTIAMWYKIIVGVGGVAATVGWFVFMVGSPVVVTLGGVAVLGSVGFICILLGNGYGLWCLAKSGLQTWKERRDIEQMMNAHTAFHKAMSEVDKL